MSNNNNKVNVNLKLSNVTYPQLYFILVILLKHVILSHWTGEIFRGQFPERTQKWAHTKQAHIALFSQLTKIVCEMSIKNSQCQFLMR